MILILWRHTENYSPEPGDAKQQPVRQTYLQMYEYLTVTRQNHCYEHSHPYLQCLQSQILFRLV